MRIVAILLFIIAFITSCFNSTNTQDYSEEFLEYFSSGNVIIRHDSVIIPLDSEQVVIHIPTCLELHKEYHFVDTTKTDSILLKRTNYTDLEFVLYTHDSVVTGKASLFPHFYIGVETIYYSENVLPIYYYKVTNSSNESIKTIGVGNGIDISNHDDTLIYVLIKKKDDDSNLLWELKSTT